MPFNPASTLLGIAIAAAILPPGYPAYIGAYIALVAALAAFIVYGWNERATPFIDRLPPTRMILRML